MMTSACQWPFIAMEEVLALHSDAMARYGGQDSPPKPGCIEASVGAAQTAAMYASEDEPDLLSAVAYLLVYLVKNHCFVDGNKRVAWAAAMRTLALNGLRVQADTSEAASLVHNVACGEADVRRVIQWLGSPGRLSALAE